MKISAKREWLRIAGGERPCEWCGVTPGPNDRVWSVTQRAVAFLGNRMFSREGPIAEKMTLHEAQATYTATLLGGAPEIEVEDAPICEPCSKKDCDHCVVVGHEGDGNITCGCPCAY